MNSEELKDFITVTEASKYFQRTRQAIDLLIKQGKVESKRIGPRATIVVHKPTLQSIYAKIELKKNETHFTSLVKEPTQVGNQVHSEVLEAKINGLNRLIELHEASLVNLKQEKIALERKLERAEQKNEDLQEKLIKITQEMNAFINNEKGLFNFSKIKDSLLKKK